MAGHAEILFLMLASLWVAYSAIATAFRIINDLRDSIIQGRNSFGQLSVQHRKLLLHNDWMVLNFGTSLVLFVYTLVIAYIPHLIAAVREPSAPLPLPIALMFYLIAGLPFIGAIGFLVGGFKDLSFMRRILRDSSET